MSGYNGNGTVCLGIYNGNLRLHEIRDFYKANIIPSLVDHTKNVAYWNVMMNFLDLQEPL